MMNGLAGKLYSQERSTFAAQLLADIEALVLDGLGVSPNTLIASFHLFCYVIFFFRRISSVNQNQTYLFLKVLQQQE